MKHSIKNLFAGVSIALITGTIMLCWFLNTTLLQRYYITNKKNVLLSAYDGINSAFNDGNMNSEEFNTQLQRICGRYNIDMLIINADSETVTSSVYDTKTLVQELMDRIFRRQIGFMRNEPVEDEEDDGLSGKPWQNRTYILSETEDYTIENSYDSRTKSRYLQMWGYLDNGNPFIIRSAIEGIQDSVKISNRFLAYIGIIMAFVSGVIVWLVSSRITKPILQLAELSHRMTNLDFDAKYSGTSQNEIGALGQNMNLMSDTLEQTISELKTANNELQRDIERKEKLDEMRSEFISNVSHELKTPIALIMGYAEGLKETVSDDPESMEFYCDVISDEADKMDIMVKKLLTLNQLEFGSDVVSMERFDIVALIQNYLNSAEILIRQAQASVSFEHEEPIFVWGDEFKVEEVFMNYFTNALNHVDGEKKITISIDCKDTSARIRVFNTGNPIPEEALEHLWEKFFKVDKARTREYGGSGVGLSIVKAIMESMNQPYGVYNWEDGVEFWFELELK